MCKALDELVKDCIKEGYDNGFHLGYDSGYDSGYGSGYDSGKDQGIITGTQEGVDKVNQLNLLLIKDNRTNDLMRAANDTEYQNELFLQYAIS